MINITGMDAEHGVSMREVHDLGKTSREYAIIILFSCHNERTAIDSKSTLQFYFVVTFFAALQAE